MFFFFCFFLVVSLSLSDSVQISSVCVLGCFFSLSHFGVRKKAHARRIRGHFFDCAILNYLSLYVFLLDFPMFRAWFGFLERWRQIGVEWTRAEESDGFIRLLLLELFRCFLVCILQWYIFAYT